LALQGVLRSPIVSSRAISSWHALPAALHARRLISSAALAAAKSSQKTAAHDQTNIWFVN
jgi:hypothetical protein